MLWRQALNGSVRLRKAACQILRGLYGCPFSENDGDAPPSKTQSVWIMNGSAAGKLPRELYAKHVQAVAHTSKT